MGFLVYFTMNKDAIVKEHCVNKAVTALKCDGKCYLKKRLSTGKNIEQKSQNLQQENPLLPIIEEIKNLQLVFILPLIVKLSIANNPFFYKNSISENCFFNFNSSLGRLYNALIFHPPSLC